ncbi:MAG: hypothetical protein RIS70_915 [Planctomycetota bacterium]
MRATSRIVLHNGLKFISLMAVMIGLGLGLGSSSYAEDQERWQAPPLERSISIRDGRTDQVLTLAELLDQLAKADVVFLGETHTDETTHRIELAVYQGLLARRKGQVTLAMEMFERDVQATLDAYLRGEIDEATFLKQSRPWENYRSAYRPLIELAKKSKTPVVASNFPRPLRMKLSMEGDQVLEKLEGDQKQQAPEQLLPNPDNYWRRVDNAVRGHAGMMRETDRLHSTQSLWDNSMGESCAKALDRYPGHSVLHVNGDFHSQYWEGTVHQFRQRKPKAIVKTISVSTATNPNTVELQGAPIADYVIVAESRAADLNEGTWSVTAHRDVKYRLHVPATASADRRVPLLIWFVDDGLTAADGLDLWKSRLGDESAIVVIEPPYREMQEDMGIGGRWYWADSFSGDIGGSVESLEKIWGYVARNYPIDPHRVCVAGEGTGATVAAAGTLLTERIDAAGVASRPRAYSKLKDFPLPLPEAWGKDTPPKRSLRVLASPSDEPWWKDELASYGEIGVRSELLPIDTDLWKQEQQLATALRQSLGLELREPAKAVERRYLLLSTDAPRARQWARMQAIWYAANQDAAVAVVDTPPVDASVEPISLDIRPENFATSDALPRCPGPFGGTTVLILPPDASEQQLKDWLAIAENDPLAKQSRFHRLRIATSPTGEGQQDKQEPESLAAQYRLPAVLEKLKAENRKNMLLIPAVFFADGDWLRSLRRSVRGIEDQLTIQWSPGLGASKATLNSKVDPSSEPPVTHDITATIDPVTHQLTVEDQIQLPRSLRRAGASFTLNAALEVSQSSVKLSKSKADEAGATIKYTLVEPATEGQIRVRYAGKMDFGLSDQKEEYTRGFRQTRGVVGNEGVYLDEDSQWVAKFDDRLIRFTLNVRCPEGWHVISQGKGSSRDGQGWARWTAEGPMDQIYLVGGPLHRETDAAGSVEIQVFLRQQDDSLSRKYLDTGARYLEMYRSLIGPYPYAKFALVENFWETGYGMPSFTLLGSQVIRFPFILHSSYPHEILHNWWGNSVFVDYEQGNWCEGLTAYMADHLIQEQRGTGGEYRRNTLQRYRDYVREGRDFPLVEFRSRHNAATEAVGYGKALMLFHMLRRELGDDTFRKGLAGFYRKHRGQRARFDDLQAAFESAAEKQLGPVFQQWLTRTGAPQLAIRNVKVEPAGSMFRVTGSLDQIQAEDAYHLQVPIAIHTAGGPVYTTIESDAKQKPIEITVNDQPLSLAVDPLFDLFRQLDSNETPPTIGQIFGQPRIVAVLPGDSSAKDSLDAYRTLIDSWKSDEHAIEVVLDTDLKELPKDRAVWIVGKENRWAKPLFADSPSWTRLDGGTAISLAGEKVPFADHSLVVIRRHPQQVDQAIGWLVVDPVEAMPGMGRKLPHYGKYSYLAFEGSEPTNTVKGQWDTTGSPLVVDLRSDRSDRLTLPALEPRKALAELPPAFSSRALASHVDWLAAPEREGRGLGTPGLRQSAEYIAKAMSDAGLTPGGDDGTWFQKFTVAKGPDGKPVEAVNVIGVLPGKRADWSDQSVVLSAHYDHLGRGWPDVRAGNEGKIHPGADDNASGVAVMLELARILASEGGGPRNLVVVAFSAEEADRKGSRHYVEHPKFSIKELRGAINLDAVGRLLDQPLSILGTGTADEWQHIFRGCTFVTGVPSKNVPEAATGSDQLSFIERGVPAVQIFSGMHGDYHRPSDTPDKVSAAGLVKVASFLKEAVTYMLEREPPLTSRINAQGAGSTGPATSGNDSGRKVLFGAVPAFDYQGPGVKLESVVPESPAAVAGLKAGDILVRIDKDAIGDLQTFSNVLKKLQADQTVVAVIKRDGKEQSIKVTLKKR